MTDVTALDLATQGLGNAAATGEAAVAFYEAFLDAEMFLLTAAESTDDRLTPEVFALPDGDFCLAFDREDRLAQFVNAAAAYVSMSGRALVHLLAGRNLGLGINLDTAPSARLMTADEVRWILDVVAGPAMLHEAKVRQLHAPESIQCDLIDAVQRKIETMPGLASHGVLVRADIGEGHATTLLVIVDAIPRAHSAIANALNEMLALTNRHSGGLEIAFSENGEPLATRASEVGTRFNFPDLPEAAKPAARDPLGPGMDPDKPPRLR